MKNYEKYFKAHPGVDKFYFTSDGMAFFKPEDAKAHAKTLKDKTVTEKNREAASPGSSEGGNSGGKVMTKESAMQRLAEMELNEKSDKEELKALAAVLEVTPKGNKKADYIEALTELKG